MKKQTAKPALKCTCIPAIVDSVWNCPIHSEQAIKYPNRHTVLMDCPHCGACQFIVPPLEKQIKQIMRTLDFALVKKVLEVLPWGGNPSIEEMKKELLSRMKDVLRRARKTCCNNQCSDGAGWKVQIRDGIFHVHFTVTEYGWMP